MGVLDRVAVRARIRRRVRLLRATRTVGGGPYALPTGYRENTEPAYDDSENWGPVTWQPDVYPHALRLARNHRLDTVVDVGCGDGRKLAQFRPALRTIGIDIGENLALCRDRWPDAEWVEHDLDADEPLPVNLNGTLVVCADVIEHVRYPDRLLAKLRPAALVVLTTPDRDLLHGPGNLGPPTNRAHVREWTRRELAAFLAREGYRGRHEYTRSRELPPTRNTIMFTGRPHG